MEKTYLTAELLQGELRDFEGRYGLATQDLLAAYCADDVPSEIPRYDAFVWAATARQVRRMAALAAEPQPA